MGCGVIDPYIAIIGASAVGVIAGGMIGFVIADGRLKRLYAEVRSEVARLRSVAEDKLSHDEPDLPSLLRNLNTAVQDTFKAAAALENHESVVARQHEGGKEVIASSRYIVRMIDELGGQTPEPLEPARPAEKQPSAKLTAEPAAELTAEKPADKKSFRRLR
jgi:hypothetical protein